MLNSGIQDFVFRITAVAFVRANFWVVSFWLFYCFSVRPNIHSFDDAIRAWEPWRHFPHRGFQWHVGLHVRLLRHSWSGAQLFYLCEDQSNRYSQWVPQEGLWQLCPVSHVRKSWRHWQPLLRNWRAKKPQKFVQFQSHVEVTLSFFILHCLIWRLY